MAKNHNWHEHQNDPDNWLRIPEFGVRPMDVAFEGFQIPILGATSDDFIWKVPVYESVRMARQEARKRYASLMALKEEYSDALNSDELMLDPLVGTPTSWTPGQVFAMKYFSFFDLLERAAASFKNDKMAAMGFLANAMTYALILLDDGTVSPGSLKKLRSEIGKAGGDAKKAKYAAMKGEALAWYAVERANYKNKNDAATSLTKIHSVEFSTARDWLKGA